MFLLDGFLYLPRKLLFFAVNKARRGSFSPNLSSLSKVEINFHLLYSKCKAPQVRKSFEVIFIVKQPSCFLEYHHLQGITAANCLLESNYCCSHSGLHSVNKSPNKLHPRVPDPCASLVSGYSMRRDGLFLNRFQRERCKLPHQEVLLQVSSGRASTGAEDLPRRLGN